MVFHLFLLSLIGDFYQKRMVSVIIYQTARRIRRKSLCSSVKKPDVNGIVKPPFLSTARPAVTLCIPFQRRKSFCNCETQTNSNKRQISAHYSMNR
ncbi:hypothetical protein CIB84_001545 [Bambusicola thoracicus]|uniref:Uncharacterized protein n=1 Tax=Bambusicola thoracicus TaxID=9083 RepID=A0A2P4TEA9_BAMTH|nr:hypothetical protein CIB84_001545 [Bambusicola thoracicus]